MTRKKITKTITSCLFALAVPVLCLSGQPMQKNAHADSTSADQYHTFVDVTNGSFNQISSTYATNNISGWSLIRENTKATTMTIDVEKDYSSYNSSTYVLPNLTTGNPGKQGADNKILMINSTNRDNLPSSENFVPVSRHEGYKSNDISLSANSYYSFQVSFETLRFESDKDATPFASIYLSGLKDESGNALNLEYERLSAGNWKTLTIFVATGDNEQTVNLELWLGSQSLDSPGVVFFDEVYVQRYSQNYFYETYYKNNYNASNYYLNTLKTNTDSNGFTYTYYGDNDEYITGTRNLSSLCELDEKVRTATDINLNFEKDNSGELDTLVDWTLDSHQNANAQVIDITSKEIFNSTVKNDYSYVGSTLEYKNKKALALWTDKNVKGNISLVSKDIAIKSHETLKVTAYVKVSSLVSGNFELKVKENENILTEFPILAETNYKVKEKSVTASSNGTDATINNYQALTIYIQGHDFYNSSFNIYLSLADETEGCVVVDSISVEKVGHDAYANGTNQLKLNTSSQDQMSTSIPNGFFNSAYSTTRETKYPLTAEGWTLSQNENGIGVYAGVINTYEDYYNEFQASNSYAPSNPAKDKTVSNNVFMFHNAANSYQSIKSTSFSLSNDYSKVSLSVLTRNISTSSPAKVTLDIYTDDNVLIYTDTISTSGNWKDDVTAYIKKGVNATSCYAVISLGKANDLSQGIAYIDNVKFSSATEEAYNSAVKKADLSNFMLNLDPTNSINENITAPLACSLATTAEGASTGGIIKGKNNSSYGYVKNDGTSVDSIDDGSLTSNVLILNTKEANTVSLTSNFNISLSANTYYRLKFRILTSLPKKVENPEDKTVNEYGVAIGLKDMTLAENLEFNDGWTECTFYFFNADSSSLSTNLVFKLKALSVDTTGYAYLTDITWDEKDGDNTFESAFTNAENLDEYGKTIFTAKYENTSSDDSNDDTKNDDKNTDNSVNPFTIFASIASGITGLALIVALVGIIMKNVKIKKIEKVRNEEYDRKITIDRQVVADEANKIKNAEQKEIEQQISSLADELKVLEDKQKANIALSRQNNGKITREIEKEFKSYAGKHARLQDKLNILNEKLENINSAEYMLSLQKKISAQMTREKKEALKQAKLESKNKQKQ